MREVRKLEREERKRQVEEGATEEAREDVKG